MASKWSKEHAVFEHRDLQANTMAVDFTGRFILLGGRRSLAIINLENPGLIAKKITRQSKWEVSSSQWNPHSHNGNLFAISCNQRTEILSWETSEITTLHNLRFHSRAVSDLDWHHKNPNLIATCSADTFINIWDLRDTRKPSQSLSAVVGATQVKWNKVSGNLLATAHEGDLRLWDYRKCSSPVCYIAAHLQKIHGVDWSESQDNHLATSSQDCTVKFFDVSNPRGSESILRTIYPVWKAKYTPFGHGLTTTQLRRGENSVLLWNLSDLTNPAYSFIGHHDIILGIEWKKNCPKDDEYNLIAWSKDQNLRIWHVDNNIQKLCCLQADSDLPNIFDESEAQIFKVTSNAGKESTFRSASAGVNDELNKTEETFGVLPSSDMISETLRLPPHKGVSVSIAAAQAVLTNTLSPTSGRKRGNSNSTSWADVKIVPEKLYQFTEELEKLQEIMDAMPASVRLGNINEEKRSLSLTITASKHQTTFHISVPQDYPGSAIPNITFGNGTNLDGAGRAKMMKALKQTAQTALLKGTPCLDLLAKHAISISSNPSFSEASDVEPIVASQTSSASTLNTTYRYAQSNIGHSGFLSKNALLNNLNFNQDHNIPYPRSSGARFCSAGLLICFGRPSYLRRVGSKTSEHSTPRALSVTSSGFSSSLSSHKLASQAPTTHYALLYPPVAPNPSGDPSSAISVFYNQERVNFPRNKGRSNPRSKGRFSSVTNPSEDKRSGYDLRQPKVVGVVTIYDASGLMPIHLELAQRYVFCSEDLVWMSNRNATAAALVGRKDLFNVWSLVGLLTMPRLATCGDKKGLDIPWSQNPLGRKMVKSIIDHYVKQRDIQTVAMLCCVFASKPEIREPLPSKLIWADCQRNPRWTAKFQESPYHTIHPGDSLVENWNELASTKQCRSNSWSESLDDSRTPQLLPAIATVKSSNGNLSSTTPTDVSDFLKEKDSRLLEPKLHAFYDNYRRCYADILYRWGLLEARALVLKNLPPGEVHRGIDFVNECMPCRQGGVRGPQCSLCKKLLLCCSICRVFVKGLASFCLVCGHGGHALHMTRWFAEESTCPSGCGCQCLIESISVVS